MPQSSVLTASAARRPGSVLSVGGADYPDYGTREDGTKKGPGFMGLLRRPDGHGSSELSIGVEIGGKETLIPSMVPTLSAQETQHLLSGKPPTPEIVQKAARHAIERMRGGMSPFKNWGEDPAADAAAARISPRNGVMPEYAKP